MPRISNRVGYELAIPQYSSARMVVMTRLVTTGSDGSGECKVSVGSKYSLSVLIERQLCVMQLIVRCRGAVPPAGSSLSPALPTSLSTNASACCESIGRVKDKAAHACHALSRVRIVEEMQRRKGTATAEHLKFVLSVIDGPRFAQDNSPGRSQT